MTADAITCEWQGGADRFTGSIAAAIASYGYPIATQSALIDAWERRQFADSVVIDRDSIRGQSHDYEPAITAMHFGSAGRVCRSVTRSKWSAEHVETALVVCAGDECIAVPSACGNVFRLTRRARDEQPVGGAESAAYTLIADSQLLVPVGVPASLESIAGADGSAFNSAGYSYSPVTFGGGFAAVGYGGTPGMCAECCYTLRPEPVTPPVPEPSTWALLLAGFAAMFVWTRKAGV